MSYVGLDIHAKHISICALSETGQVAHRWRVRCIEEMLLILKGLPVASRSATRPAAATATSTTCCDRWRRGYWWRIRANCG